MSARDQLSLGDAIVQSILSRAREAAGTVTSPYATGFMCGLFTGEVNMCLRLRASPRMVEAARAEIEAMFPQEGVTWTQQR